MYLFFIAGMLVAVAFLNLWLCLEVHATRKAVAHLIDRMFLK